MRLGKLALATVCSVFDLSGLLPPPVSAEPAVSPLALLETVVGIRGNGAGAYAAMVSTTP